VLSVKYNILEKWHQLKFQRSGTLIFLNGLLHLKYQIRNSDFWNVRCRKVI